MIRHRQPLARGFNGSAKAIQHRMPSIAGLADMWIGEKGITIVTGVSNWQSIAGGRNSLVQATGANQPTYTPGALNGRAGLATNGTTQFMRGAFTRGAPRTTFIVGWFQEATGGLFDGNTVNTNRIYRTGATVISMGNGGAGGNVTVGASTDLTNPHVHCFNHTAAGTSSTYQSDSFAQVSFDAGATTIDGITIGDLGNGFSDPAACTICCIVDFNVSLSNADKTRMIQWLGREYNIT